LAEGLTSGRSRDLLAYAQLGFPSGAILMLQAGEHLV
jgi:hypothetical protein